MKPHRIILNLIAVLMFVSGTHAAHASPVRQDPQDALIREVLTATATDLGWNTEIEFDPENGSYSISPHSLGTSLSLLVLPFATPSEAMNLIEEGYSDAQTGVHVTELEFHGYPGISVSFEFEWGVPTNSDITDPKLQPVTLRVLAHAYQLDRYDLGLVCLAGKDAFPSGAEIRSIEDTLYAHAVQMGLVGAGDGNTTPPTTPEPTATITEDNIIAIHASAENHEALTQYIDNAALIGEIAISGRVLDAESRQPIAAANIRIISGARPESVQTDADGYFSLTANVANGDGTGEVILGDFTLSMQSITIQVFPEKDELMADGVSSTPVVIQVLDPSGNPLPGRTLSLSAIGDAGPGMLQPAQATTDGEGIIHATYTAYQLDQDVHQNPSIGDLRREVTLIAHDDASGASGSNSIFISQYNLTVVHENEYIPPCTKCNFPSKFFIQLTDYWNTPIANAPLTVWIDGGAQGGLIIDPNTASNQRQVMLTTDDNGWAEIYYKWQGDERIAEAVERVVVQDDVTHAQWAGVVNVHGLDLGIARIKEAGFTGVTGQQAFLKIYFKDIAHPDLPLERFNVDEPNKLALRVSISQFESDGVNTSPTFEGTGTWDKDETGMFVKMYTTPLMPYITPVNDGTSWYEIRIDPVVGDDTYLPDLFRANNDTIIALTTGSPDNWLHIWLQDGVLTPHTWTGVVFKCVARFLPGIGNAITIIDTLNQTYKQDVLGLSQSTAQVLTDNLEERIGKESPKWLKKIDSTKAAALNNVVSCLQDSYAVYSASASLKPARSAGHCATLAPLTDALIPYYLMSGDDEQIIAEIEDKFVQGMFLDSPDVRTVIVYHAPPDHVRLQDELGQKIEPQSADAGANLSIFILPASKQFRLETSGNQPFSIGVYGAGNDDSQRTTVRQNIQTTEEIAVTMPIGKTSDYQAEIDYGADGVIDDHQPAKVTVFDVVKPQITGLAPPNDVDVRETDVVIASYEDDPNGSGIDPEAIRIFVDDEDFTHRASIRPNALLLPLDGLGTGEHTLRLVVVDRDGNAAIAHSMFYINDEAEWLPDLEVSSLPISFWAIGGLSLLGLMFLSAIVITQRRKRNASLHSRISSLHAGQSGIIQDQSGNWRYQDVGTGQWMIWNGHGWQPVQGAPVAAPVTLPPQPAARPSRHMGCLAKAALFMLVGVVILVIFFVLFSLFASNALAGAGGLSHDEMMKCAGGLLIIVLGLLLIRNGVKAIVTKKVFVEDEYDNVHEKRGCSAVLNGLGQLFFGAILVIGGLGLLLALLYS